MRTFGVGMLLESDFINPKIAKIMTPIEKMIADLGVTCSRWLTAKALLQVTGDAIHRENVKKYRKQMVWICADIIGTLKAEKELED